MIAPCPYVKLEYFVVFYLLCPSEEGSDELALVGIWHPASGPPPQFHSPVLVVSVYLDLSFTPFHRRQLIYAAGLVMALNSHCSGASPHKNKNRSMACFALIYDFMA